MQQTAKKVTGAALAVTAAALFSVAPMNANAAAHKAGKCFGINSCKGQTACATATNACAGQNACKGQGWLKATKAECDEKGGKFEMMKK